MKKTYLIITLVIILIAGLIGGIFLYKHLHKEDDGWVDESGDKNNIEYIFSDIPKDYWASDYILYLVQRDIMSVDDNNYFYPEEKMTVKDFLIILLKTLMPRVDVSNLSNQELISFLQEKKLLDKDFKEEGLDSSLTNYDIAVLTAKADLHIRENSQEIMNLKYIDLSEIDEVGKTLIGHAVARGFIKTKTTKRFNPQRFLTRAEIAEVLYLFLNG